jgi:exopolyphosphatase/guanosine-5'-triphosphate,3'-diphosphate pyrophosphatase
MSVSAAVKRRAVIDVGTNSVKLLVGDVRGRTVLPVLERSEQTRLGEGFYKTHTLHPNAIARTAASIANFVSAAAALQPESVRIIATSSARDAVNQADLVEAIKSACALPVEIISGEQEAQWAFAGVTSGPAWNNGPALIFDVGGGSTEFIFGEPHLQHFRRSFPLGTVRLLEQFHLSDPPAEEEWRQCSTCLRQFFQKEIRPALGPALKQFAPDLVRAVGTGGSTTILARIKLQTDAFDRAQLEAVCLDRAEVARQRALLWSLPLHQRKKLVGLPPNRADVILMGAAIFAVAMEEFSFEEIRVSTRGLRFAALMDDP